MIREAISGTYMRLEYLGWDIQEPGNNLLGAPIAGVDDPRDPFLVQTATGSIGVAESLSTDRVDFQEINGIRGTVGIPFRYATLEGSFWGLEQGQHTIQDRQFLRNNNAVNPRFIAVGLRSDGQVGNRRCCCSTSRSQADYTASAWGSDVNLILPREESAPGPGLPAARRLPLPELSTSRCRCAACSTTARARTRRSASSLIRSNRRSARKRTTTSTAAQVGFKADFKHEFFTLAFEPKLAFGANDYSVRVTTDDLRSFDDPTLDPGPDDLDDPPTNSVTGRTVFSPTVDLGFSAEVHLTDWFHVRAGYNFIWTGNLARADRAIYYNDIGNASPPAVTARQGGPIRF